MLTSVFTTGMLTAGPTGLWSDMHSLLFHQSIEHLEAAVIRLAVLITCDCMMKLQGLASQVSENMRLPVLKT